MSLFQRATKSQSKLRLALFGPSGAGKTYTALRIATGMGGKIAVIDTERGSASKYADKFTFDAAEIPDHTIDRYIQYIKDACNAGYNVLIIDSMSHAWESLLEEIDLLTKTKYKGNSWQAWSEGTPKQREFVETMLRCNCHIIATMRSKTEWTTEQVNGKMRPVRVGTTPVQRSSIEYEFDMLMEISPAHTAEILKDRTGKFQDKLFDKPGEDFGKELVAWLNSGEAPAKQSLDSPKQPANGRPPETAEPSTNGGSVITKEFITDVGQLFLDSEEVVEILMQSKRTKAQYDVVVHKFGCWMTDNDPDRLSKYYAAITGKSADNRIDFNNLKAAEIKAAFENAAIHLNNHINKLKKEVA